MQELPRVDPRFPECALVPHVRDQTELDDVLDNRTRQLEDDGNQFGRDEPRIVSGQSERLMGGMTMNHLDMTGGLT